MGKIGDHSTAVWWGGVVVVVTTWLPHLITAALLFTMYLSFDDTSTLQLSGITIGLVVMWALWYCKIVCPLDELREMGGKPARPFADMPPVYPNGWFRVAHSHQLGIKQVHHVSILGQELAVFRGEGGRAYVLDAYCTHLGANMAVGGVVLGDSLQCPFHGWTYDGETGRVVDVPYLETKTGSVCGGTCGVPESARVKQWVCLEQNGVVLVWFDAEGREPVWFPPVIEGVGLNGNMVRQGMIEHQAHAHIQDINENGVDSAHFNAVHSWPLSIGEWAFGWLLRVVWSKMEWVPQTQAGCEHMADSYVSYNVEVGGCDVTGNIKVKAELIGPSIGHIIYNSHFGRVVILVTTAPLAPLRQQATFTVYTDQCIPSLIAKLAMWSFCAMFEQDVPIWNSKRYERKPVVVRGDGDIMAWRRWYRQFYSDNSPTVQSLRDSLAW